MKYVVKWVGDEAEPYLANVGDLYSCAQWVATLANARKFDSPEDAVAHIRGGFRESSKTWLEANEAQIVEIEG